MLSFKTSAYNSSGLCGAHMTTDWQVANDSGFNSIIFDSSNDPVNLTEIATDLNLYATTLYVRARHNSSNCQSPWSLIYQADIPPAPPNDVQVKMPVITPSIVRESIPSLKHLVKRFYVAIPEMVLLNGTANHVATDWYVKNQYGDIVWQSENNSIDLLQIAVPPEHFIYNHTYILEARYVTDETDGSGNAIKSAIRKKKFKTNFFNFTDQQPDIYFHYPVGFTANPVNRSETLNKTLIKHSLFKDKYLAFEKSHAGTNDDHYLSAGVLDTTTNLWNPLGYILLDFEPMATAELNNDRVLIIGFNNTTLTFSAIIYTLNNAGFLNSETVSDTLIGGSVGTVDFSSNIISVPADNSLGKHYFFGTRSQGTIGVDDTSFILFEDTPVGGGDIGLWTALPQPTVNGITVKKISLSRLKDNRLFLSGGYSSQMPMEIKNNVCLTYYPVSNTWVTETFMPVHMTNHCQITTRDNEIIIVGDDRDAFFSDPEILQISKYNLDSKQWLTSQLPGIPKGRRRSYGIGKDGSIILSQGLELDETSNPAQLFTVRKVFRVF